MKRTPPEGKAALQKKRKERADLKAQDIIWIGIAASENNIQRLGAYLMFAEYPVAVEKIEPVLLPWEDPNDPRFQQPPELEIDYNVVKHSIAKHLVEYVKKHGEDRARSVLTSFGAQRLSSIPQANLIPLNAALEEALKPAAPAKESDEVQSDA